jgi:N-glycosyltransferase
MADYLREEGLRHLPAGEDWRPRMAQEVRGLGGELGPRLRDDDLRYGLALRHFTGPTASSAARALLDAAKEWRPDVVVRSWLEFGGYLAAEALGIPHVSLGISGGPAPRLFPAALAPLLAPHRASLGLPPDPAGTSLYRYRHIALVPAGHDPAVAGIPHVVHYRHENLRRACDRMPERLTDALADRGGRPAVLVSFGTLAPLLRDADRPRVARLVEAVIGALAELDCFAVVAGRNLPRPERVSRPPQNVHFAGDFPSPLFLEHCDLFLTHAGFNSVRESLSYGVPMVTVPLIAEQSYNAAHCVRLGLAENVRLEDATVSTVAAACRRVLTSPHFRDRARMAQKELWELPPLDEFAAGLPSAVEAWRLN